MMTIWMAIAQLIFVSNASNNGGILFPQSAKGSSFGKVYLKNINANPHISVMKIPVPPFQIPNAPYGHFMHAKKYTFPNAKDTKYAIPTKKYGIPKHQVHQPKHQKRHRNEKAKHNQVD